MNAFDTAILVVGSILVLVGAIKGVARISVSIASLIGGFILAAWFGDVAGSYLGPFVESKGVRNLIGFTLIFAGVNAVGALAGWFFVKTLGTVKLRWIDRLAGAAAGLVATVILFSAMTIPLAAWLPEAALLRHSRIAPYVMKVGYILNLSVPHEVRARFHEGLDRLKEDWERADRETSGG